MFALQSLTWCLKHSFGSEESDPQKKEILPSWVSVRNTGLMSKKQHIFQAPLSYAQTDGKAVGASLMTGHDLGSQAEKVICLPPCGLCSGDWKRTGITCISELIVFSWLAPSIPFARGSPGYLTGRVGMD